MRLFLSVIGSGNYPDCRFVDGDNAPSANVHYVQEALLPPLTHDWTADDRVITVMAGRPVPQSPDNLTASQSDRLSSSRPDNLTTSLTDTHAASQPNNLTPSLWLTDWAAMPPIPQDDYLRRIEALALPCPHQLVTGLPDGLQSEELWQLFSRIYELINDDDELWLDVTYGVRYFPMLMLVLDHYAKFLKHIRVRRITYANYEAMIHGSQCLVPIQDLTTFSVLQDWTIASALFLETGRTQRLSALTKEAIEPLLNRQATRTVAAKHLNRFVRNLERVTDEWRLGRGSDIIEANTLALVKQDASRVSGDLLPPFAPLFDKVCDVLQPFQTSEEVSNGFQAARWCYEHQLYQQCITLLQESIITLICLQVDIDWHCSEDRELVSSAFHIVGMHLERNEQLWQYAHSDDPDEDRQLLYLLRTLVHLPLVKALAQDYKYCSNVRNDLNHAGMRVNPMTTADIKGVVGRCLSRVISKVEPFCHPL